MTQHTHREHIEGCFRCDLSREEVREYVESTPDTREVREMFTDEAPNAAVEGKRFDRWLNSVKADVWEEGRIDGVSNEHEWREGRQIANPYLEEDVDTIIHNTRKEVHGGQTQ